MELVLRYDQFVDNKLYVEYNTNRQAMFTIVDENFGTKSHGDVVVNKITCMVRKNAADGVTVLWSRMLSLVIGIGMTGLVGVTTDKTELLGKELSKDNMEGCTVILYED